MQTWRCASQLGATVVLGALLTACGSSGDSTGPSMTGGSDGVTSPDGNTGGGGGEGEGETRYPGAQPCDPPIDTGFGGDSQCLQPPEGGFQLHYGPADYDDPAEMERFYIMPGDETVDCTFMQSPNQEDVFVDQYHSRLRPGTHHMITYMQDNDVEDTPYPTSCNQGLSTFLVGATTPTHDIGTGGSDAPENQGLGLRIPANKQLAFQMHYINTTDEPILKEGWINVVELPESELREEVSTLFWLGGLGMAIPPRTNEVVKAGEANGDSCTPSQTVRLVTMVAHAHANTQRISAYLKRQGETERQLIYETYDWEEPGFLAFDSLTENPEPDPTTGTMGGASGILEIHPGDQLSWECDVQNEHDDVTLTFTDRAYDGEMCNMFGVYSPTMGGPWNCFSF